jgi:hypothetical protein
VNGRREFGGRRGRLRSNRRIGNRGRIIVDVLSWGLVVLGDSKLFSLMWYEHSTRSKMPEYSTARQARNGNLASGIPILLQTSIEVQLEGTLTQIKYQHETNS